MNSRIICITKYTPVVVAILALVAAVLPTPGLAQTRGILGFDPGTDSGFVRLFGTTGNSSSRLWVAGGGDDNRGILQLYDNGGERVLLMVDGSSQGLFRLSGSTGNDAARLTVRNSDDTGILWLSDSSGQVRSRLEVDSVGQGVLVLDGSDDSQRVRLSVFDGSDHGFLQLFNDDAEVRAEMAVDEVGQGYLVLDGSDNSERARLSVFNGSDNAFLHLSNADAEVRAQMAIDTVGQGYLVLDGSDNTQRARLSVNDTTDNGFFQLHNDDAEVRAEMAIDSVGQGYLVLDGSDNTERARLSVFNGSDNAFLHLSNADAEVRAQMAIDTVGQGYLVLDGSDNTERARLSVFNGSDNAFLYLSNADAEVRAQLAVDSVGQGSLVLDGSDNTERAALGVFDASDSGVLRLRSPGALVKAELGVDATSQGYLALDGADNTERARVGVHDENDTGFVSLRGDDGVEKARLLVDPEGRARLSLDGGDGETRARLNVTDADTGLLRLGGQLGPALVVAGRESNMASNQGAVRVFGHNEPNPDFQARAELLSDPATLSGQLILYDSAGAATIILDGDAGVISKSGMNGFRISHPRDPSREIFYSSLEGPEAGVYVRGSATLQRGSAVVELPEHFSAVARKDTMTVQLTPSSADTYGLAATEKSPAKIVVQELAKGTGSFSFDYTVYAERADIARFEPVRQRRRPTAAVSRAAAAREYGPQIVDRTPAESELVSQMGIEEPIEPGTTAEDQSGDDEIEEGEDMAGREEPEARKREAVDVAGSDAAAAAEEPEKGDDVLENEPVDAGEAT